MKQESTYNKPEVTNSYENRSFLTSARVVLADSDLDSIIDQSFNKLMENEEEYLSIGSSYRLESIDGILLIVYRFKPMVGGSLAEIKFDKCNINDDNNNDNNVFLLTNESSYIELPNNINCKRGIINPQSNDQQ